MHVSPQGGSCVSVGSGLLRADTTLQAKQADETPVACGGGGLCSLLPVLQLVATRLLSHRKGGGGMFMCTSDCLSRVSCSLTDRDGLQG